MLSGNSAFQWRVPDLENVPEIALQTRKAVHEGPASESGPLGMNSVFE
jgi:hypothetical protein